MLKDYGILGKDIEDYINEVKREIGEILKPVRVLPPELESKTVFNLDDLCLILGYESKDKQKIREACQRGDIPYQTIGRDYIFPRPMIVDFLLGNWKKKEKKSQRFQRTYQDAN